MDIALGLRASSILEKTILSMTMQETLTYLYFHQHKKQIDIAVVMGINISAVHSLLKKHFTKEKLSEEKEWRKSQTELRYRKTNQDAIGKRASSVNDIENLRNLFFNSHLTYKKIGQFRGTSAQNIHKLVHKYFSAIEIEKEIQYRLSVIE